MQKKDYTKGDGTAFEDMARVTPGLRSLIYKHTVIEEPLPFPLWVNVRKFTLWEPVHTGGFYRIMVDKKGVRAAIEEYMARDTGGNDSPRVLV